MTKIKRLSILIACIMMVCTGCQSNDSPEKKSTTTSQIETKKYIPDINDYELTACEKLDNIPKKPSESVQTISVTDHIATIVLTDGDPDKFQSVTKSLYTYDLKNDVLKKVKEFKNKEWLVGYVEMDDANISAHVEYGKDLNSLSTIRIEKEKNGKVEVLLSGIIDNYEEFRPFFIEHNNTLYFMFSHLLYEGGTPENTDHEQSLYSYKDGKLTELFKVTSKYQDSAIKTNNIYALLDGTIMFQEFKGKGSILHEFKDGKSKEYKLATSDEIFRARIDHYAVIYYKKEDKHKLLDLETNKITPIDFDEPIYDPANVFDTAFCFLGDKYEKHMVLAMQKDGTIKIEELDILGKLKYNKEHYPSLFFSTDGEYTLISIVDMFYSTPEKKIPDAKNYVLKIKGS